jgi:hypothetical protein
MGPNVKKLIAHKMALDAIPPGGGVADGASFLLSGKLGESAKAAAEWVKQAIAVIKAAPDNPYGDDDEAIAAEILRRVGGKQNANRSYN